MGQESVEEHPAEDCGTPQSRAAAATIMRRIKRTERGEARFYTMEESLKDLKKYREHGLHA
jgi:hypothetical protein